MSPDVIGTIIAGFGLVATFFGGVAVMIRHADARNEARFERLEAKFETRCDQLELKFDTRCDELELKFDTRCDRLESKLDTRCDNLQSDAGNRFARLEAKIDSVAADVVDLKVAVARIEGPQTSLLRV